MRPARLRASTLAGGLFAVGFGVWLLLDAGDVLTISFSALGPALAAAGGLILLISGLEDRG